MSGVKVSLAKLKAYVRMTPGYILDDEDSPEIVVMFQPHTEEALSHMHGQSVIKILGRMDGEDVVLHRMVLEDERGENDLDPESLQGWILEVEGAED